MVHSFKRHFKTRLARFCTSLQKQFSSQKNAYYAQVEALNLTKKDIETVRHFPLKVQQLIEKGWCNENASTINLKCNESFTRGLPKNLKDFANKRQVKHTSTVLETSIPFHTLVKLVDAEDSGASISVLNYPTYVTIAKLLNIKQNNTLDPPKTLTVANQTKVPILHCVTTTSNTTIEDDSRQFTILFAVADIMYNILGTPFFEENIQNINKQGFTLQFKH